MRVINVKTFFFFHALMCVYVCGSYAQAKQRDSVTAPASLKFKNISFLRTMFIGKNYRKEWTTPSKLPVFRLRDERGGFTIKEAGGGRQTNNLRLEDKHGTEWVLRSVDKNVVNSVTPLLRNTMMETLMEDLLSASHPYAALTVPLLAEAVGVTVATPSVFFIPDDTAFGEHRALFANTVCFLEEREPTPDGSETKNTNTVMEKVTEKAHHLLLQEEVLKARLLDMLIADWDRHADQWRWGVEDSAGMNYYYPIPRDRDFAYFRSNGLFVKLVSLTSLPYMWGFTNKAMALKRVNAKVSYLDAQWLNELDAATWKKTIALFQRKLTDSIIESAVRKLPKEIYALRGKTLSTRLKQRRNGLMKHAMRYYRFLASNPFVVGTDEQDSFTIISEGKNLTVRMTRMGPDNKNRIVYQRKFNPRDTKNISIIGLGGNDQFKVDETASSSIKLQLKGGEGEDVYSVKGRIKTRIGDVDSTDKKVLAQK